MKRGLFDKLVDDEVGIPFNEIIKRRIETLRNNQTHQLSIHGIEVLEDETLEPSTMIFVGPDGDIKGYTRGISCPIDVEDG